MKRSILLLIVSYRYLDASMHSQPPITLTSTQANDVKNINRALEHELAMQDEELAKRKAEIKLLKENLDRKLKHTAQIIAATYTPAKKKQKNSKANAYPKKKRR